MQQIESTYNKVSETLQAYIPKPARVAAVVTVNYVGYGLVFAALATNAYDALASPTIIEKNSCEATRPGVNGSLAATLEDTLIHDTSNFIFWTSLVGSVSLATFTKLFYPSFAKCSGAASPSDEQLKTLEIMASEGISAASTAALLKILPIPKPLPYIFLPTALIPLVRLGLHRWFEGYQGRASLSAHKKHYPNRLTTAYLLGALDSLSTGVTAATAVWSSAYFILDSFYDASHAADLPHQALILTGVAGAGFIVGAATSFNETAYRVQGPVVNTLQKFYLICMPALSIVFCLSPSLENMKSFSSKGVPVVLGTSGVALPMAISHTCLHERPPKKPQRTADAEEGVPLIKNTSSSGHCCFWPSDSSDEDERYVKYPGVSYETNPAISPHL